MSTPPDVESVVAEAVDRALWAIRTEFTSLPRFAYHLPLDYDERTLPPRFDPPVWLQGEPLPLPPVAERHGHTASDTEYLDWGRHDKELLLSHICRALPSTEKLAIMDFGCSSGRVLRHFHAEMQSHDWKLTGVDVSARKIEWMRRHFPQEYQVYTGTFLPSMPFESNSFDVIYGMSVFTHIKFLWDSWLLELRRILKPGGIIVQTIHTENAWNFFTQHGHEDWARNALGSVTFDGRPMPDDFVYIGNLERSHVFVKSDVAAPFWGRYFRDVEVFPPPERFGYQDWIIGRK